MNKTYTCICGRVFDNPQKFNAHKQGCKVHIINKYGSTEVYYAIKNRNDDKGRKVKERARQRKLEELNTWISEMHTCERCGKIMTSKYSSGRFCSRSCANSHKHSEETKKKISATLASRIDHILIIRENNREKYYKSPKLCAVCKAILPYEKRYNKTCCIDCAHKLQSIEMLEKYRSGINHTTVRNRYKYGTYKSIHCDSSWELAFVMYLIDHNIAFERNNKESFIYTYKERQHLFFPDFIIDGVYVEIKNYESELTTCKINCFPKDKKLKILYYSDMKKYLNYAIQTYGKEYYKLYDKNYPSWMKN